jgi:hypothetical protein
MDFHLYSWWGVGKIRGKHDCIHRKTHASLTHLTFQVQVGSTIAHSPLRGTTGIAIQPATFTLFQARGRHLYLPVHTSWTIGAIVQVLPGLFCAVLGNSTRWCSYKLSSGYIKVRSEMQLPVLVDRVCEWCFWTASLSVWRGRKERYYLFCTPRNSLQKSLLYGFQPFLVCPEVGEWAW